METHLAENQGLPGFHPSLAGRIRVHRQRLKQSRQDEADEHPQCQSENFLGFPIPSLNHGVTMRDQPSLGETES
jgi:hypothetical protein